MMDEQYLKDNAEVIGQIIAALKPLGLTAPVRGQGVITGVERHPTQGYPLSATGTVNGAENQRIEVGANDRVVENEEWTFLGDEDPIGRIWVLRKLLVTSQAAIGPDNTRPYPTLVVPSDGVTITQDNPYTTGPNGTVNTLAYINYRTIVPGTYDVFGYGLRRIHYQVRETGTTVWKIFNDVPIWPWVLIAGAIVPVWLDLLAPLTAAAITATAGISTIPVDSSYFIVGQPVYWQIDNEVFEATWDGTTTLSGLAHRAVAADHATGTRITLLSGQVKIPGLQAGTVTSAGVASNVNYQAQIAAMDAHNGIGPYSTFIPFSGYIVPTRPGNVTNLTVTQVKTGTNISWTLPEVAHRKNVNVYRSTIAVANAWIADTSSLPGTMKLIATISRNASTFVVPAADPAGIYASGNYLGIEVVDNAGNRSDTYWSSDTTPPPNPNNPSYVSYESGSNSITVTIAAADTARNDEGWKNYVLYSATALNEAGKTKVAEFMDNSFTFTVDPSHDALLYQVVSEDWAGNIGATTPNDSTYWKYVPSLYWTDKIPLNGNFQLVNTDLTFPKYWENLPAGTYGGYTISASSKWSYLTTGGLYGNKTLRITDTSGTSNFYGLRQSIAVPVNPEKTLTASLWMKPTQSSGTLQTIHVDYVFELYSDDAGTVLLGTVTGPVEQDIAGWVSGTWYQMAPKSLGHMKDYYTGARSMKIVAIFFHTSTAGANFTWDIDDFLITVS